MNTNDIKVLIVDDHSVIRVGLRALIEESDGLTVIGEAGCLDEAYNKINELIPDVVLLDMQLPDGDGVAGCSYIKKINTNIKVVILTAFADDAFVIEAIKAGANGYLLKTIDSDILINAIISTHKGGSTLDSAVVGKIMNEIKREKITDPRFNEQEINILELISDGKSNKEISQQLNLAEKTVRNYVSKLMKKVAVDNRTGLAVFWTRKNH